MKKAYLSCVLFLGFLMGVYNGHIALWADEDPEPRQVFPYAVASLPEADQAALEKGIPIESQEQLCKYLEDFLS